MPPEIATDEPLYLGDLLLAYPYTLSHAIAANHSPFDAFALLVVHGILHLVGYNHDDAASQQTMWAKQHDILTELGIHIVVPDFIHD